MRIEYVIRWEGPDMVAYIVANDVDHAEIHRESGWSCERGDDCACLAAIGFCQFACEADWGGRLDWILPEDDDDPRLCFTRYLSARPRMIGLVP